MSALWALPHERRKRGIEEKPERGCAGLFNLIEAVGVPKPRATSAAGGRKKVAAACGRPRKRRPPASRRPQQSSPAMRTNRMAGCSVSVLGGRPLPRTGQKEAASRNVRGCRSFCIPFCGLSTWQTPTGCRACAAALECVCPKSVVGSRRLSATAGLEPNPRPARRRRTVAALAEAGGGIPQESNLPGADDAVKKLRQKRKAPTF